VDEAPFESDRQILGHASTIVVAVAQVALGHSVALHHGLLVPEHGLCIVGVGALAAGVHPTEVALRVRVALLSCALVPGTAQANVRTVQHHGESDRGSTHHFIAFL
jgi:hypothetical protein